MQKIRDMFAAINENEQEISNAIDSISCIPRMPVQHIHKKGQHFEMES